MQIPLTMGIMLWKKKFSWLKEKKTLIWQLSVPGKVGVGLLVPKTVTVTTSEGLSIHKIKRCNTVNICGYSEALAGTEYNKRFN